ncbi:MAG: ester cyclase [Pseudomonadota bacterium]
MSGDHAENKALAREYWRACDGGGDLSDMVADEIVWDGQKPMPRLTSRVALEAQWLTLFRAAFPNVERQFHILMAGASSGRADGGPDGRDWVGATGYLNGVAAAEVMGIPPAETPLRLRWGEFLRIEDGRIAEIQMQIDLMDWFEQIGRPVLPAYQGAPRVWPAPTAFDGVLTGDADEDETAQTLELGRGLLFGGLNVFDESDLVSMGMATFFHPNLKWYGPAGIGACLSLKEFEDFHQRPWLDSFPDRKVQDLPSLFAEGRLLAASGPAAVKGTHGGAPFRSSGPGRGQPLEFSGLDFWLRTHGQFTENWVFVDFVHLFDQMGVDLMARMRAQ